MIRRLESSAALSNAAGITSLEHSKPYAAVAGGASKESQLEKTDSLISINSISSIFSDPSDQADTRALLDIINTQDIKNMFPAYLIYRQCNLV